MTRILVIEDEEAVRQGVVEMLEASGYQTLAADGGRRGLNLTREQLPNLIICDVAMPDVDGFEVLAELQRDPVTATIPFIFLTAKTQAEDRRRGMRLGADDYLTKPFTFAELQAAIETRLAKLSRLEQKFQRKLVELRADVTHALPHELRTPLTGILGFAAILADSNEPVSADEQLELAQHIYSSGLRLQHLIENFLLFAKLEDLRAAAVPDLSGHDACEASELIATVARQESARAQRQADLALDVERAVVALSGTYLKKLIEELINNAFKFSVTGTPVSVEGRLHADGSRYVLHIRDRGRGLSAQEIADIGAYRQFGRRRREQQGAGLGLAIANLIVELCHGTLEMESRLGSGTTLRVCLPCAP